jgi:HTH-type transcriptional regulator/antitoxin HigA
MEIRIIQDDTHYQETLDRVDALLTLEPDPSSPEGEELKVLLLLVKEYDDRVYPIPMPEPIEAIRLKMDELGLKSKDLIPAIGSKSYVSSVLNRRKPMTLNMARNLHKLLHIPAEVLLQ